jgi:putative hydrolase of the HAD superfamily
MLPGGGREEGEDEAACVAREVLEETALTVRVERLLFDCPAQPPDSCYVRWQTYLCSVMGGQAVPGGGEGDDARLVAVKWLPLLDSVNWPADVRNDPLLAPQLHAIRAGLCRAGQAMPAAMLIDLDDTILAFDAVADECWKSLCVRYAPHVGVSAERVFAAIARSRSWYWSDQDRHREGRRDLQLARRHVVARAFAELGLDHAAAIQLADDYTKERELLVKPFPGAVETLRELRARGVALALVTNGESRFQRAKIERFDLARHFDFMVVEGDFGIGKPDHAVFRHALSALGCGPQDAWMVGDSLVFDIAPAMKLGMEGVWIDGLGSGLPPDASCKPTRTLSTLAEILVEY